MSIALAGRPAEHPLNIERPKRTLFQQIWKERTAYLLVTPALLGYLIFWAYPVLFAFVASFTRYDAFTMKALPNLLDNYHRALFRDPFTKRALLNVLEYVVITLGLGQIASLTIALALNSLRRGVALFRTIYYIPIVTSVVTVATIFRWLFGGDPSSPMNVILKTLIGVGPIRWLREPLLVIPLIGVVSIWIGLGFNAIIWMAGLKAIPNEYYEVATIDGASGWRQFWSITLPLLKPVITFQFVMGFIGGMKEFGLPLVMTTGGGGGISLSAITPVLLVYKAGFTSFEMGYASAVAFLLTLLLIVATILQFRLYGKSEAYE
jgi:ABC-type sugar transport system permease subunit